MRVGRRAAVAGLGLSLVALASARASREHAMDSIAERYVKLVLALGVHDEDTVDAYYGPPEWRETARRERRPVAQIAPAARALAAELERTPPPSDDELALLRHVHMDKQLTALAARAELVSGRRLSFDAESQALYDAVAPVHEEADFRAALAELERALPGRGALRERYDRFRQGYLVPEARLDAVFQAAIAECRRRTLEHIELPREESFSVEYVRDKPWGGYNWYQGGYRSVIQVNTDLPVGIDRALDLACHEGYPGHHAYNVLLERDLVRRRGFVEFTVYPLFSPRSLIAEGTANYGVEVAFPRQERSAWETRVLFPLAGLDAAGAEPYSAVQRLMERLSYASNEAARRYVDGRLDREAVARWLETYTLATPERARQRAAFIERYRSYVVNYNLGRDLVRGHVEASGGTAQDPRRRWEEFARLLASPRVPSRLARPGHAPWDNPRQGERPER